MDTYYSSLKKSELVKLCQDRKLEGYSKLNCQGLVKLLVDNDIDNKNIIYNQPGNSTDNPNKTNIVRPILKWVGGKTQIIDHIVGQFPKEFNNYREIFLGGGSVLLAVLSYIQNKNIKVSGAVYAYDINQPLIYVYKNIQNNVEELYKHLEILIGDFQSCSNGGINRKPTNEIDAKQNPENYYYWIRQKYNSLTDLEKITTYGSSLFIFLNKTCFRGIFRLGPNGFNVPYGHYKNPEIINKEHLYEVHKLIQGVIFQHMDCLQSIGETIKDDFIYLDPPYAPETETSFVGYTADGFDKDKNLSLFARVQTLAITNKLMMSNSDVPFVRDSFTDARFGLKSIVCRRAIHSKNPETKTKELIITNY